MDVNSAKIVARKILRKEEERQLIAQLLKQEKERLNPFDIDGWSWEEFHRIFFELLRKPWIQD